MREKSKSRNIVSYLCGREYSVQNLKSVQDVEQKLMEDKATIPSKNQACELSGQCRSTFLMTFSPDGNRIASAHGDHTVRVTNLTTGACTHILRGHPRSPWCIAFHPCRSDLLASGCLGGQVRIWDLRGGGSEMWSTPTPASVIASLTFHPTDQLLVIATHNELYFWDWTKSEPFTSCTTSSSVERVRWVKFDPLGQFLLTGIANSNSDSEDEYMRGAQVSFTSDVSRDSNSEDQRVMRDRYRHLVNQINTNQSQRINEVYPLGSAVRAAMNARPPEIQTFGGEQVLAPPASAEIDIIEPRSPVHHDHDSFAARVTSITSQALANARRYAAHVTEQSARMAMQDDERQVVRIRNEHAVDHNDNTTTSSPENTRTSVSRPTLEVAASPTLSRAARGLSQLLTNLERTSEPETTIAQAPTTLTASTMRPRSNSSRSNTLNLPSPRSASSEGPQPGTSGLQSILRCQLATAQPPEANRSGLPNLPSNLPNPSLPNPVSCTSSCSFSISAPSIFSNSHLSNATESISGSSRQGPIPSSHASPSTSGTTSNEPGRERAGQSLASRSPHLSSILNDRSSPTSPENEVLVDVDIPPPLQIPTTAGDTVTVASLLTAITSHHVEQHARRTSVIREHIRQNRERRAGFRSYNMSPGSRLQFMRDRIADRRRRLRDHLSTYRRRYHHVSNEQANDEETSQSDTASRTDPEPWMELTRNMRPRSPLQMQQIRSRIYQREQERRTWHNFERRLLHPHYAVSILDDTVNRSDHGLQAAINRAIAGAYVSTGEMAVATNIVNLTHRVQRWDFTGTNIPDISQSNVNIIVPHCKLHNDSSVDISSDGRFLATFVPIHRGFPDDTVLALYSLLPESKGECLYTKSFGPNAISVSISPLSNYVLVGLASKKLAWVFTPKQMVAQVFKLKKQKAGEDSMDHICDLMHPCDVDIRSNVSVNAARWLPRAGDGLVYGTNRGDLHICRPGYVEDPKHSQSGTPGGATGPLQGDLMSMLGMQGRTNTTATQTVQRIRRSAATQTDQSQASQGQRQ